MNDNGHMNTKIKYINAGTETLSSFVPTKYLHNITSENSLFFAAFSDTREESQHDKDSSGNMQGVILYKTYSSTPSDASLIYIFVKSEFRSKGVAKALLKETLKALKLNGKTNINCRIFSEPLQYDESTIHNLLESFGFRAEKKGDIIVFSMACLLDTCFTTKLMDKLQPFINNVKKINEIDKSLLSVFANSMEKKGRSANLKILHPEHTRYYIKNGKIRGYAAIDELQPGILLMKDTLILTLFGRGAVIPSIIADILESYLDHMHEDSVLAVDINDQKIKKAMIGKFGDPAMIKVYVDYYLFL